MEIDQSILVSVCVIGEVQVGKSKLIDCFATRSFTNFYAHTVGDDSVLVTQSVVRLKAGRQVLKLQICETHILYPANVRFKGVLLVYDITNRASFEKIAVRANSFRRWVADAAAVLVGTKLDLAERREVNFCEGVQVAERLGVPFLETSAKTAINVDQAFFTLLAMIGPNMGFSGSVGFKRNRDFT